MNKKRFVVLGAGPAGLAAAWKLVNDGQEVFLVEREDRVGGLGASFEKNGFILDYGPHAIHVEKGDIIPFVRSFFDRDLIETKRNIMTLAHGRYLKYPFEFYNLLTQLNPFFGLRIIFDFLMASWIYKFIHVPDDNFESWGIKRFGKTLYNFCFGNYTEKVWGIPARLISPKFAARKIRGLDFKRIISKLLGGKGEEHEIYWEDLLYPQRGSGELFNRIAKDFEAKGGNLYLSAPVTAVHCRKEQVNAIQFHQNGMEHTLEVDYVISTLPVKNFILMMRPAVNDYIFYITKRLRFRGIIFVYVVLETEQVSEAHWVYLLDEIFAFNRFTEQKNISKICCPGGRTVLCLEMCCGVHDPAWHYSPEQLKEMILNDVKHIKIIDPALIRDCFVAKKEDAYAVCHLNYEQQLKDILEYLSGIDNVLSTGRQGLYMQIDMHDSMALGFSSAEFFINQNQEHLSWYQEKTSFLDWDRL